MIGLVHDVARDEQRRAAPGESMAELPEVAAQDRVEPDRRLVEHEQVGLAEQRSGKRDPCALAAGEAVEHTVAEFLERDVRDSALHGLRRLRENARGPDRVVRRGSKSTYSSAFDAELTVVAGETQVSPSPGTTTNGGEARKRRGSLSLREVCPCLYGSLSLYGSLPSLNR